MDEAEAKRRMQDPDLAQKRKAAIALFDAAINEVAVAHAHARQGKGWERQSAWAWSRLLLQKSSAGFACYLNIDYAAQLAGQRGPQRSARIGAFAASVADHNRLDSLYYVDLGPVSALRDEVMDLLQRRAMPWLDRCHSLTGMRERNHVPFGLMPQ
jgi:hypothetical protein